MSPFSGCAPSLRSPVSTLPDSPSGDCLQVEPPSEQVLHSVTTTISKPMSSQKFGLTALPSSLICLIKFWLVEKDSLQLIKTSHNMHDVLQQFYTLRLRDHVGKESVSAFVSYQNPVNRLPKYVPMGPEGEGMFQQCMSLKAIWKPEGKYLRKVIRLLKSHMAVTNDPAQISGSTTGAALGLGGGFMTEKSRNALFVCMKRLSKKSSAAGIGAMVKGLSVGFGVSNPKAGHHTALFDWILTSGTTFSPAQMESMILNLCLTLGGRKMTPKNISAALAKIISAFERCTREQLQSMMNGLCQALGGNEITPEQRNELIRRTLDSYSNNRRLPLESILANLFRGIGRKAMTSEDINAVMTQIVSRNDQWNHETLHCATNALCEVLGPTMPPEHRNLVMAKILASCGTSSPPQMGSMIWALCRGLSDPNTARGDISQDNLNAIIDQVLSSPGTCSALQVGTMLYYIYVSLGAIGISSVHRHLLKARILESPHSTDIIAAIKRLHYGQQMRMILHLEDEDD